MEPISFVWVILRSSQYLQLHIAEMVRCMASDELQRIWKKAIVACLQYYAGAITDVSLGSRCPGRDSN